MRNALLILVFVNVSILFGQSKSIDARTEDGFRGTLIDDTKPDTWLSLDTIKAPAPYENLYNRLLYADSLSSSFAIFIKNEVKEHKHEKHSENIVVLDGEAMMKVDGKSFKIKKGDLIFVPKNTWHYVKVTSKTPLKVLSIQSPNFNGKDRVFKENK